MPCAVHHRRLGSISRIDGTRLGERGGEDRGRQSLVGESLEGVPGKEFQLLEQQVLSGQRAAPTAERGSVQAADAQDDPEGR
jgi:hypothetical protein